MNIVSELKATGTPKKAAIYRRFFKTGKGEYGEGDKFLGLSMPEIRKITGEHRLSLNEIKELLKNEYHEVRMAALINLVNQYEKSPEDKYVDFYLANTSGINNWDLVDVTCNKILGKHILRNDKYRNKLYELSESNNMWEQRISIVSTSPLIYDGQFDDTLTLSKKFLDHKHDLIHKACGWMLREVGKRDVSVLKEFLDEYATVMPRTMLRYSIEKFDATERKHYLDTKPL